MGVIKPDGSVTTTEYDNAGRVLSTVERSARDVLITGFEYTYDILGRVLTEKQLDKNLEICYTYDELSRVTSRIVTNCETCSTSEETFNYDSAGNIVSSATNSDFSAYTYDRNNRLTSYNGMDVTYDADGNMTSAFLDCTGEMFEYDSMNRLIRTNTNAYTYNAENVRIRNLCGEDETTYVYDSNAKLSRLLVKTTGGKVTKYVYGRGLIGEETDGEFKTYHFDYRGSTVALTDMHGDVTDTFEYDTYGKLTARTGTSDIIFLYNGRDGVVTDSNGLIYMRARYYSPELRRFVNADILAGRIDSAVTLNRYAYANGNPVSLIDPRGLSADSGRGGDFVSRFGYGDSYSEYRNKKSIEELIKIYNEISDMDPSSVDTNILKETLKELATYFQSYCASGYYEMTAMVYPSTIASYEFSLTSGTGGVEIAALSLEQLNFLASLSYDITGNASVTVTDDGLGISYTSKLDDINNITTSISTFPGQSLTIGTEFSTDLGNDVVASTELSITHFGTNNNDPEGSSPSEGKRPNSAAASDGLPKLELPEPNGLDDSIFVAALGTLAILAVKAVFTVFTGIPAM